MSEDEIRSYLAGKGSKKPVSGAALVPKTAVRPRVRRRPPQAAQETYKDFSATHLFCPKCQQATPVRERLMLFLPDGDLYDYLCTVCHTPVGTRKAGK